MKDKDKLNIKHWAREDRPREKLLEFGPKSMTDSELIAVLIGSGSANESAVELSRRILNQVGNNLLELSRLSIDELLKFKGIGYAKAVSIVAALELGKRRREVEVVERITITSSDRAFEAIRDITSDLNHEEFWVLLLNRSNKLVEKVNISKGGVSGTVVDLKIVFKLAIDKLASGIILCHNHPSGNLKPSEADVALTNKLREAGKLMEIPILDHLIVHESKYFSFADEGML